MQDARFAWCARTNQMRLLWIKGIRRCCISAGRSSIFSEVRLMCKRSAQPHCNIWAIERCWWPPGGLCADGTRTKPQLTPSDGARILWGAGRGRIAARTANSYTR